MTKLTDEQVRELRRTKLKTAAKLRAELMFQQNLERIDHRLDVIEPELEALTALAEQGELAKTTPELGG